MKVLKGGVTTPKGFKANGFWAGIKRSAKPDLGLIFSEAPCVAAAVFTRNSVKAAPIVICMKHIKGGDSRAVIANSGNANCFTGEYGLMYAQKMTEIVGEKLGMMANRFWSCRRELSAGLFHTKRSRRRFRRWSKV